ncbi:MAG: VaFE repeat-containing surface-anchored protein, partial [Atopobiaceae bacterium]|nr:VaFE repeat-containing surface-anchored protein [Atopobiaceae bacterium]
AGEASTGELYLGTYTVYEAKAKDGFALNVDEETVELTYQGQEVEVFELEEPVTDTPTEIKLRKVDATDSETPVAGATFRVWDDEGSFDEEYVSDENGDISIKYIGHGSYHVQETAAPEGYVIYDVDEDGEPAIHDFTVNDQGMIEFDGSEAMTDVYEWTVENMPKTMRTTAIDKSSGTHEGQARGQMAIIDTVEYTGCIPGQEYTVSGTLMDKETGEAALDADGKEITASTTFKAEGFTGTVEIEFAFDGVDLAGHDVVAFETMEHEGKEYMVHADIEDEGQTVRVVDIHTTATNPETGDNLGSTSEELEIVDVVAYENLTPGSTYHLTATLHDSVTGTELLDSEGKPVTAEVEFTPEEKDGTAEVRMTVSTDGIAGHTLVFFERLADAEGNTIATHADSDDEGQSIHFADIHTTAVDGDDGDKNVIADDKAKVVDTVAYENLIPGKEYVLEGKLVDKATGEALKDAAGKEIVATAAFTPEKPDGTVDVAFEFDGSKLAGKTAVAFETLSRDGIEIAVHADVDDEAQTVAIVPPEETPPGKGYPKTGGSVPVAPIAASIVVIAGCGAAGAAYALGKRRKVRKAGADAAESCTE